MKFEVTKEMKAIINKTGEIKKVNILGLNLEIQQHIPHQSKVALATRIAESGLSDDGKIYSQLAVHVIKQIEILRTYTNIEFGDDILADYDALVQTGFYDEFLKHIPYPEIEEMSRLVAKKIEDTKGFVIINNSVPNFLENLLVIAEEMLYSLETLTEDGKLEDVVGTITKSLEKLDPNKLEYVNEFLKVASVKK